MKNEWTVISGGVKIRGGGGVLERNGRILTWSLSFHEEKMLLRFRARRLNFDPLPLSARDESSGVLNDGDLYSANVSGGEAANVGIV